MFECLLPFGMVARLSCSLYVVPNASKQLLFSYAQLPPFFYNKKYSTLLSYNYTKIRSIQNVKGRQFGGLMIIDMMKTIPSLRDLWEEGWV